MKRLLNICAILGFSLMFAGCPFSPNITIDGKAMVPVDPALIGEWRKPNMDIIIRSKNGLRYEATMTEYNTDSNRYITKTLVAFISVVGSENMLNIINDEHNIFIGTYKFTNDKLDINLLSNAVSETNEYTGTELRKLLEEYKTAYNNWPYDTDKDYTGFTKKRRGR